MPAKNYSITINNPDVKDEENLTSLCGENDYLIFQYEIGESKTPHIQAYIRFEQERMSSFIKTRVPRAHIEVCKGTPSDNIKYCSKPEGHIDGPYEFGKRPVMSQGKGGSHAALCESVLTGSSLISVLNEYPMPFIRYHGGIKAALLLKQKGRRAAGLSRPVVSVFWGVPGSGKSYAAQVAAEAIGEVYMLVKTGNSYWWDGYCGQPCVIVNDFYGHYPYSELLNVLDAYDNRLNIKGSSAVNLITHIWFTSNKHPCFWYKEEISGPWLAGPRAYQFAAGPNALERRISNCVHFGNVFVPVALQ